MSICHPCSSKYRLSREFWALVKRTQETLARVGEPSPMDYVHFKEEGEDDAEYVEQQQVEQFELVQEKQEEMEEIHLEEEILGQEDEETIEAIEQHLLDEEELKQEEVEDVEDTEDYDNDDVYDDDEIQVQTVKSRIVKVPLPSMFKNIRDIPLSKKSFAQMTPEEQAQIRDEDRRINEFFKFDCKLCPDQILETYADFKKHMRNVHDDKKPSIYCCNRKLYNRAFVIDHVNFHTKPEQLTCPKCSKVCRDRHQLKFCLEKHEDPNAGRNHQCKICLKSFYNPSMLKTHGFVHMTPAEREQHKTYKCPECGKAFVKQAYVAHHIRLSHKKKYECICDICARPFNNRAQLKFHFDHVHATKEELTEECPYCNAKFAFQDSLQGHIKRMHIDVGSYTCTVCNKISSTLTAHRTHVRYNHMTEESYKCEFCSKVHNLLLHCSERTHLLTLFCIF